MSEDSPWMTTEQAAAYAGVHIDTLYAAAIDGRLQCAQRARNCRRRYRREWLDAWISGETPPVLRSA